MSEIRQLRSVEFSASFEVSEAAENALMADTEKTMRTLTITHRLRYSRWYRAIIAILRFAYGWLGYQGPPREVTTFLPHMKITSVVEDERGLTIQAVGPPLAAQEKGA